MADVNTPPGNGTPYPDNNIPVGPPMPQPNPSFIPDLDQGLPVISPPPYVALDPNPEVKEAMGLAAYPPFPNTNQPSPYPYVHNGQPGVFPAPPHGSYYPPGVTTYTPGLDPGSTVIIHSTGYKEVPVVATCTNCRKVVTTRAEYVTGSFTWMMCCLICLFCPLFCWLIPFCMVGMKDVYHYCPNCNHVMGVCKRM